MEASILDIFFEIKKMVVSLKRNIKQIQTGGIPILRRKFHSFSVLLWKRVDAGIFMIVSFPFVVLIRLLRPFVVIRLGCLDIGRIGGSYYGDWYLCERNMSKERSKKVFDIFYFISSTGAISNRQWLKMWTRILPVFPFGKLAHAIDMLNQRFSGHRSHVIPMPGVIPRLNEVYQGENTLRAILARAEPFLTFTLEEEKLGQKALRHLGIPEGASFICFHARDSAYLDALTSIRNWSYHDYRDSDIQNYLPGMEALVREEGYYAIRMGAVVKEKVTGSQVALIDYATNGKRTDFLDLYLGAKCRFFLCSDAGISIIPELFRRPMVYVNWAILRRISPWVLDGLVIPKKFYKRSEHRFLTFPEIINSNIGEYGDKQRFEEDDIELIENTPEEITAVTLEMEERLKGSWVTNENDEVLQACFWDIFAPDKLKSPKLRIGTNYLRQNAELLKLG